MTRGNQREIDRKRALARGDGKEKDKKTNGEIIQKKEKY